jgi:hypothetical protein
MKELLTISANIRCDRFMVLLGGFDQPVAHFPCDLVGELAKLQNLFLVKQCAQESLVVFHRNLSLLETALPCRRVPQSHQTNHQVVLSKPFTDEVGL